MTKIASKEGFLAFTQNWNIRNISPIPPFLGVYPNSSKFGCERVRRKHARNEGRLWSFCGK
jgi:hypothetical protein